MAEEKWKVFALFSENIQECDLREAIRKLRAMELGGVWPLSVRYPTLSDLEKLEFIKLADVLLREVDPSEPRSSCGLKKDK